MTSLAPTPETLPVELAWQPVPSSAVDADIAAHLLRRIGFSATPEAVNRVLSLGLAASIEDAFRRKSDFEKSADLQTFEATISERHRSIQKETDPEERRRQQNELRREETELFHAFAMQWYDHAAQPENSAREKFVLFLQDVFVVQRQTVRETVQIFNLQQTLRNSFQQPYPELCKAISREPAMIRYLNLNENTREKPNENFARELFELFTLGEGNGYTEADIKEASRAFTGYRVRNRYEFHYHHRAYDNGAKTIFGEQGNWNGDEVIDLTFQQPAARTFLIQEFIKFYLADELPDTRYIEALGNTWAAHQFRLDFLIETIFQSRLFHHPHYRGNQIKSPTQFYLGLCQDLRLDIIPFESKLLRSMRAMGQAFFDPPNVRGWLYGTNWINSTTISARRQLVDYLFEPLDSDTLNGNERRELKKAQKSDRNHFLVTSERLSPLEALSPEEVANHLSTYFITAPSRKTYLQSLQQLLEDDTITHNDRLRFAVIGLLQSPAYNLC